MLTILPWGVAGWLLCIGLYGIVTCRNYVHLIGCLSVVQSSTYVLLLAVGYRWDSIAPIFYSKPPETPAVDPVLQALVLHRCGGGRRGHSAAARLRPAAAQTAGARSIPMNSSRCAHESGRYHCALAAARGRGPPPYRGGPSELKSCAAAADRRRDRTRGGLGRHGGLSRHGAAHPGAAAGVLVRRLGAAAGFSPRHRLCG